MPIKHPFTGRRELLWDWGDDATRGTRIVVTAYVEQEAKYKRGSPYKLRNMFAAIRRNCGGDGLVSLTSGYVVVRNSFDEMREFHTVAEAQLYIEALYALEYGE
jgi:hypothetical protein